MMCKMYTICVLQNKYSMEMERLLMKIWARISCIMLVLLVIFAAIPVSAIEEGAEEDKPEDFVILLDCSMSLGSNDPQNLCLEACKNFVDKLPTQNARVSVIAFGYADGAAYTYSSQFNMELVQDAELVHVIVPFGDLSSTEAKGQYKNTVENAIISNRNNKDTWTPIGHALAAAVDMLEQSGSADGKACIILVSDGVHEPKTAYQDKNLISPASELAGKHQWPIYSIELNYNNSDKFEVERAQVLLDQICANSGDRAVGRISCETPRDVHVAFQKIFHDFYNLGGDLEDLVKEVQLPGEYMFEIPALTSEATVDIFGASIEYVELVNVAQGASQKIKGDVETENLIAVVEEGSYYSVKMLCPAAGQWKVLMHGDANATVLVSNSTLQEMGLTMVANPSNSTETLTKKDTIAVDAFFAYHESEVHNSSFYVENPASVVVYNHNGTTQEFVMDATPSGYTYQLKLSDIPSGAFDIRVVLNHSMFRNGKKISNSESFKTENLPLQMTDMGPMTLKAYVNGDFERIDLNQIFNNPDKDPITYSFGCISDRTAAFNHTVESDYLEIAAGLVPGTFEVELTAKDPDMEQPLTYTFTLVVDNRLPQAGKIKDISLLADFYGFQEPERTEASVVLNEYFLDPDGMPLTYSVEVINPSVANVERVGDVLCLTALSAGETVVTVTAEDGCDSISTEFKISVSSGKAAWNAKNGPRIAIAAVIFAIFCIVVMVIRGNMRVKGEWNIKVSNGSAECYFDRLNIRSSTKAGRSKKGKFSMIEMLSEITPYMKGDTKLASSINAHLQGNTAVKSIFLKGVTAKKGCKVCGIPNKKTNIVVSYNGTTKWKSFDVTGGYFTVVMNKPDGTHLDIRMELL